MADESSKIENLIQSQLDEAKRIARKTYSNALLFLGLGLLVASIGVFYFYFSNDAVFLDRTFYEDKINSLQASLDKSHQENSLLSKTYDKRIETDSANTVVFNKLIRANNNLSRLYRGMFNNIVDDVNSPAFGKEVIGKTLTKNSRYIDAIDKNTQSTNKMNFAAAKLSSEREALINKYLKSVDSPVKISRPTSTYDRPELVFSPKLVYGFFSRLGGLLFIEIIAFYLLKQYRVNMTDFKYYDNIVRQTRANLYLVNMAEKVEDEKTRMDMISRFLSVTPSALINPEKDEADSLIGVADIELVKKLLDSVKDFVKK